MNNRLLPCTSGPHYSQSFYIHLICRFRGFLFTWLLNYLLDTRHRDGNCYATCRRSKIGCNSWCIVSWFNGNSYVHFYSFLIIHIVYPMLHVCRLFGITNIQTYFYFRNYKQDWIFQKCMVVYLWYDNTPSFMWYDQCFDKNCKVAGHHSHGLRYHPLVALFNRFVWKLPCSYDRHLVRAMS